MKAGIRQHDHDGEDGLLPDDEYPDDASDTSAAPDTDDRLDRLEARVSAIEKSCPFCGGEAGQLARLQARGKDRKTNGKTEPGSKVQLETALVLILQGHGDPATGHGKGGN